MKKFLFISGFFFFILIIPQRIFAATITACPGGPSGTCIQQAVETAKDGDTIIIPKGTYQGAEFVAFTEGTESHVDKCFVNLHGKSLTLQGEGNKESVLFGQGHDQPYVEPYASRAGICTKEGKVTINNLRIKEFQKRCMILITASIVMQDSIVEGCDEGGITMLDGSTGVFVNNFFVSTSAVMLMGKGNAKMVNNTLFGSNVQYFPVTGIQDFPTAELTNNIIVNGELTIGIPNGTAAQSAQIKDGSKFSHNLIWKSGSPCYPSEYCDTYPGKVDADPMFVEPVVDQRGMAGWANFGFKDGSPAVNAGDPAIPGGKDLGAGGGPCATPNSPTCTQFIQNNSPAIPQPIQVDQPPPEIINKNNNQPNQANPFGVPLPLSRLINPPNNVTIPNINTTTKSIQSSGENGPFNLFVYFILSIVYIMVMHLAVNMGSEFSLGLMITFFVLGGFIGGWMHTYEAGFALAIILSLIFISGPKKEM